MRLFSALLLFVTTFCVSSDEALATTSLTQLKQTSPNTLVSNDPISAGERGTTVKRSLRVHGAVEDDEFLMTEGAQEERGVVPKAKDLMEKLHLEDITEAIIVRGVLKDYAPDKILTKIGVRPSFVTAEGQKIYSKYDPGYRKYRAWDNWVKENLHWIVKDLK